MVGVRWLLFVIRLVCWKLLWLNDDMGKLNRGVRGCSKFLKGINLFIGSKWCFV